MIVTRFWRVVFLLTAADHVFGLNQAEFSATLQQAVVDMLGSGKYEVTAQSVVINHLIRRLDNDVEMKIILT